LAFETLKGWIEARDRRGLFDLSGMNFADILGLDPMKSSPNAYFDKFGHAKFLIISNRIFPLFNQIIRYGYQILINQNI
jgi:hypothetical protein